MQGCAPGFDPVLGTWRQTEDFSHCPFVDERNPSPFSPQHKSNNLFFFPLLDSDMGSRPESLGCRRDVEPRAASPTETGTNPQALFYTWEPGRGDKTVMPSVRSVDGPVSICTLDPGTSLQALNPIIHLTNTDSSSEGRLAQKEK